MASDQRTEKATERDTFRPIGEAANSLVAILAALRDLNAPKPEREREPK